LPAVPAALSPQASEFILLCLQRDPAARPSAEALLRHPFVVIQPGTAMSPALAQQLQQAQQLEQGPPARPLSHPSPSAVPSPSPSNLGGGGWQPGPSTVLGGGKGWPAQAAAAKAGATLPAQAGLLGHTTVKHGATEEELEDALAALVLGSNLQTLAGYAADRAAARDGPSGGGAGIGVGQEEEGVKPDAAEEDRESIDREIDEGIDYTTQPALFKWMLLLSSAQGALNLGGGTEQRSSRTTFTFPPFTCLI
ncbi:protein kinase domain-containing protein, partial [Haematococcus lacustris]